MIVTKPTINAQKATRDIIFSPAVHAVSAAARKIARAIFVFDGIASGPFKNPLTDTQR